MLPNDSLDPLFLATVQATEEAVVNAMVAAETMKGIDDHEVIALPHDRLREVLKQIQPPAKVRSKVREKVSSFRPEPERTRRRSGGTCFGWRASFARCLRKSGDFDFQ